MRKLEIGSGTLPLIGFEHLDIQKMDHIEYVCDASEQLPFEDETFDLIFASHVLEHIPYFKTEDTLKEWHRVLKENGALEIWVPDMQLLCSLYQRQKILMVSKDGEGETNITNYEELINFINKKMYFGSEEKTIFDLHKAFFDEQFLKIMLERIGFKNIEKMNFAEAKGHDHGILNLGIKAIRKDNK